MLLNTTSGCFTLNGGIFPKDKPKTIENFVGQNKLGKIMENIAWEKLLFGFVD